VWVDIFSPSPAGVVFPLISLCHRFPTHFISCSEFWLGTCAPRFCFSHRSSCFPFPYDIIIAMCFCFFILRYHISSRNEQHSSMTFSFLLQKGGAFSFPFLPLAADESQLCLLVMHTCRKCGARFVGTFEPRYHYEGYRGDH